jgi:ClpP class serine protease
METIKLIWSRKLRKVAKITFWMFAAYIVLSELLASTFLESARTNLLEQFQEKRKSRVIAMIHRQDTLSLFGVPVSSSISIEDSEAVLRAIRLTPQDQPIDLLLHTPGGLLLAAEQISKALTEHKGKVTVFIPHYAMSGGTLMALAADEIVMDSNAVLGPVDPQIGDMPAASIVNMVELKHPSHVSDEMLVLADIAQKARVQATTFVAEILRKHMSRDKALALATMLSDGRFTHDFPITVESARELGLPVSINMPPTIYDLMDLYPQAGTGRPSVLYTPLGNRGGEESSPDTSSPPRGSSTR